MKSKTHGRKKLLVEYGQIIFGASLVGLGYNLFLLPAKIAAGGISGISTLLFEVYEISPALVQFLINIPIFIIGWLTLGRDFSGKTLVGTFWVPLIIYLSAGIPFGVTDHFIGSVYGGVVLGIGLGIVYLAGGSTGGTAALAQVLRKFTGLSSGYSQLAVDGAVVIASLIVFNLEITLYALLSIYISSKSIDMFQLRTASSKLILIITKEEERIRELIHEKIDRGFTKIESVGGYSGEERSMILSVTGNKEAVQLKNWLQEEEPNSFVVFINASDILGRGFTLEKYHGQNL